ncbi:MAG: PAS domain S-box protein [Nitrospiraceae bacterium]|nr:MAG: PAS domain S-box protein [Nitrospiraceae bacterium]
MKILIVEDDSDSRVFLERALKGKGYPVETAVNGIDALDKIRQSMPDLIISDIMMPEMDGFDLCRAIKSDKRLKNIPFIFYTATYTDSKDEELAMSLGASRFIVKPLEIDMFLQAMGEVIRDHKEKKLHVPNDVKAPPRDLTRMHEEALSRKLEKKVRELELYRQIFTNAHDAIAILGPDGRYAAQNTAHRALTGYTDEELKGRTPAMQFGEREFDRVLAKLIKQFVFFGELLSRTKDGDVHNVELSAFPITDEKGKVIYYVGIQRDITRRKQAEMALRLSEEKFEKAFRSSPTLITLCTLEDNRFIEVNDAFLENSGYNREEVIGRESKELHIWTDPAEMERVMGLLREDGIVSNYELSLRTKAGDVITVLWSAELIDIQGSPCVLAVALDITDRKKLEEQLLQSQKMEAIGQLAGGVAHDFNNILTAITSYAYMAEKKVGKDEALKNNIMQISSLVDKAAEISRGLLAFSRKHVISTIPININSTIISTQKMLTKFIGEDIDITVRLAGRDLIAMADSVQIEQVIMNLVTNARDAMPRGGQITIETECVEIDEDFVKAHGFGRPGPYVLLKFSDTGSGIDQETKKKIFEPFFTTKEIGRGSGLGLSIIYGIITQHNGYINVYSEKDSGTSFNIYLPLYTGEFKDSKDMVDDQDYSGKGETVLLAEDDDLVRRAEMSILTDAGYKVIEAVNGNDAVEKYYAHKDRISLLILDVIMPKKNGREAYEEIKRHDPSVRAIFTSGYTSEIMDRKGILIHDVDLLMKPVVPTVLLKKIKEVIGG